MIKLLEQGNWYKYRKSQEQDNITPAGENKGQGRKVTIPRLSQHIAEPGQQPSTLMFVPRTKGKAPLHAQECGRRPSQGDKEKSEAD